LGVVVGLWHCACTTGRVVIGSGEASLVAQRLADSDLVVAAIIVSCAVWLHSQQVEQKSVGVSSLILAYTVVVEYCSAIAAIALCWC